MQWAEFKKVACLYAGSQAAWIASCLKASSAQMRWMAVPAVRVLGSGASSGRQMVSPPCLEDIMVGVLRFCCFYNECFKKCEIVLQPTGIRLCITGQDVVWGSVRLHNVLGYWWRNE